jgi:hypothetical protein
VLDALNRTVLAEVRDALGLQDSDLYFIQHESEEFLNVAKRKAQVDFNNLEVTVPDRPLVFVRLDDVDYARGMAGYHRTYSDPIYINDLGGFVGFKLLTIEAKYRLVVYSVFGRVGMDLAGVMLEELRRSSIIKAVSADEKISVDLPVSLLLEKVNPPTVEMVLREKGMKLYKIESDLQALGYMLQMGVKQMGTGGYGLGMIEMVTYKPIKSIRLRFKMGWSLWDEDGNMIDEVLPCVLNV